MPGHQDPAVICARYERVGDCHLWTGATSNLGYGRLRFHDRQWYAHRFVWTVKRGDIPAGKVLDHLCGNRRCINVDHLEIVWHEENARRGRPSTIGTLEQLPPALTLF